MMEHLKIHFKKAMQYFSAFNNCTFLKKLGKKQQKTLIGCVVHKECEQNLIFLF